MVHISICVCPLTSSDSHFRSVLIFCQHNPKFQTSQLTVIYKYGPSEIDIFFFQGRPSQKRPNIIKCEQTLSASSLFCRLFIRIFQSSLAFPTLALIPSTLSLDTTTISSSPLAPTVLSLAWPCSLSLKNSCGDTQTKELRLFNTHTRGGGCECERRRKIKEKLTEWQSPTSFCLKLGPMTHG